MSEKKSNKKSDNRRGKNFKYEFATGMGLDTNTVGYSSAVTKKEKSRRAQIKDK